jgi:hypothetical protein
MIELAAIRTMIEAVFRVYRAEPPIVPPDPASATAFGAALTAP